MTDPSTHRTGVFVARLWSERHHATKLRARIVQTLDTESLEDRVDVSASVDDICAIARRWAQDFADSSLADADADDATPPDEAGDES